ncbi:S8 family serine peptidase [Dokdonella sp.]|uniref:S8 family serine peptidase n=1 Tax=Dokdonella sp. TaxID=2291710 RepID=UPI003C5A2563
MKLSSAASRGRYNRAKPLASALALTLFTGLTASASAAYNPVVNVAQALPATALATTLVASDISAPAYYTIVFKEAPLATYAGNVSGLPAPSALLRNGEPTGKLDVKSPAALAYVSYLQGKQEVFISQLGNTLGRPLDVMARMQHGLNAVIVRLSNAEASEIKQRSDVDFIEREHQLELDTDRGPSFIGAPSIWGGTTASGVATKGEGILVGVIDTGVNWESPAFAAVGPIDGYVHVNPLGSGNYLGQCQAGAVDAGRCNDKLIGIYNFAAPGTSGADTQGHGSHTASTTAGNAWNSIYASGPFSISGVAPHANVVTYLACPASCPSTATSQAANQAVADGVDVINYSISGGTSPWTDATSTAFRNGVAAGMFVAASAGNTSTTVPNPIGQVNHMEPWVETVAASTEDRIIAVSLDLTSEANPPANTQDVPMRTGGLPLPTSNLINVPLIKSPNFANGSTDGCAPYPADTFVRTGAPTDRIFYDGFDGTAPPEITQGAIAVLHLDGTASSCGSGARRTAALAAGAVGVIFVDVVYLNLGAADTSWSMVMGDWLNLEAGSTPATAAVSIDIAASTFPAQGDVMGDFSFRGPRTVSGQGMVKPDITGPGVDILAAGSANLVGADGVYLSNGTSMSSPHMAGAAALMRALNPTWSPTQIKSALNLSSNNFGVTNIGGSPATLWDYGSGRVNLTAASQVGLIMDETSANFLAANPATGGQISTLNLASMAKTGFIGDTQFTRTFRRARAGSQTYTLSVAGFPAGAIEFSPASFTVSSSGSKEVTVTAHGGLLTSSTWNLGELILTPSSSNEPVLHLPIALNPAGPVIQVNPTSLSGSSDTTVSSDLTITNIGNPTLNWTIATSGTATVTPLNTATSNNGQLVGSYTSIPNGFYWSQNFDTAGMTHVTTLRANGFVLPSITLTGTTTPQVTFSIYADNAGFPAGAPQMFGAAPIWTYSNSISNANGISTAGGNLSLNLNAAGVPSLDLPSGRYWMTVYPTINGGALQTNAEPLWAWRVSTDPQVGNLPVLYDPGSNPGLQTVPTVTAMSAFVQGTVSCALPSWASASVTSGSLGIGASDVTSITFNANGLAAGVYKASLCVNSNATNGVATVPLSFTVPNGGATPPTLSKAFAPTSVMAGQPSTLTLTLSNSGPSVSTLGAALTDSFPAGLVVAATPAASTDCVGASVTANAGSGTVSLGSGAQIPATGSCTVTVDVTANTAADYDNTIAAGALQTNTGNNAAAASATLTVTPVVIVQCTTTNPVEIEATAGTVGPSGFSTLKDAFDAINAGTHQGVVDVTVCADTTETASSVLNASGAGSASYTAATIKPAGGAARTVSGAMAAGSPLIDLAGADNVTIDGLNSGGNALTLSNTTVSGTAGTSTIRFIEGATNNVVTNATILGSATGATTAATGTVLFSTSTVAGGNSNNTVSNNDIGPAGANSPSKAIQGLGTSAANANAGNAISGNKIHDYFVATGSNAGISVYNFNTGWTIANNRIYQTAPRTFTSTALRYTGILIDASSAANGGDAFQITGNVIGFGAADGTGTTTISGSTNEFRGILLNGSGATTPSTVQGNTVSGIAQSSARNSTTTSNSVFIGIQAGGPSIDAPVDVLNNTIGSLDGSSTIVINSGSTTTNTAPAIGILDYNWDSGLSVSNNAIGAITLNQNSGVGTLTGFRGILSSTTGGITRTIDNNTIGGTTVAGGIVNNLAGGVIYGMQVGSTTISATGNVVQNITNNCTTVNTVAIAGLLTTGSTGANVISQNTFRSLVNNAGTINNSIYALYTSFATSSGSVVERNFVHSLVVNSTALTSQIAGILPVAGSGTYKNNMVRLGYDAAGNSITAGIVMYGMFELAGTNNIYNNSIYVGGTDVVSSSNTFAFVSNVSTGTRNYVDNIFWNARSNASGTGVNTAGLLSAATGATSDYNDLFADGAGGVAGPMAAGLDANSVAVNPLFVNPTGTSATVNLHLQAGSPVAAAGTPIVGVTDDFDGDPRSATAPSIGADE